MGPLYPECEHKCLSKRPIESPVKYTDPYYLGRDDYLYRQAEIIAKMEEEQLQQVLLEADAIYEARMPKKDSLKTKPCDACNQAQPVRLPIDPEPTRIFVGGLSSDITKEHLQLLFESFGQIASLNVPHRLPPTQPCGFVTFALRQDAETAINQMQSYPLTNGHRLRLSWGRRQ